jgi:hypothetical protein
MLKSIAIVVAFALAGCAATDQSSCENWAGRPLAWDGLGPDLYKPERAHRTRAVEKPPVEDLSMRDDDAALAAVPKYSKEWVALYQAMQVRDDARVARAMIICRGC